MDNFSALKKIIFAFSVIYGINSIQAQEKNLQKVTEYNFKQQYNVDIYEQFPTFPKYISTGNKELDDKDFETRGWAWVKTHPEYNTFLVSKLNRNPVYNSSANSTNVQPASTGKGGDGITPKVQK